MLVCLALRPMWVLKISLVFEGVPAACFPGATGLASSWDTAYLQKVGKTIAQDCKDKGGSTYPAFYIMVE